jgi:hypothetical protein
MIYPPRIDEKTLAAVRRHLFERWLVEQEAASPLRFE